MIFFAPFEPDKSPFNTEATDVATNAIPVADGWGPFPSFEALSATLGAECKGAIVGRSTAGDYSIFAFTATAIKKYVQGTATWTDVSRLVGGAYNLADDEYWSIIQFGPYIVATNIGDVMQVYDLDSASNFSALAGSPPQAKYIWVCGGYLFAGNTTAGADRIYNSGLEDISQWTVGEAGSDFQPGGGSGEVVGGVGDQFGGYVFYSDRVRRIQLTPNTGYTYSLTDVNVSRPTVAPYSIVNIGPNDFIHYCNDGFFRGPNATPIGAQRVDEWFADYADLATVAQIQGTIDPIKKIAWFTFQTTLGTNKVLGYHWQLDRWTLLDTVQTYLVPLATAGYTLEDIAALYPSIEDVPYSLDSYVWAGGRPAFAGFNSDGTFGFFSGGAAAATLETANVQDASERSFVNAVRPITDAAGVSVAVGARDSHSDTVTWGNASTANSRTGLCPARSSGRLHKYRMTIPADTEWTIAHGVEPVAVPEGQA